MKKFHQKIYLVRHGETEWSQTKRHTGLTDIPLTDGGRNEATWLKDRLGGIKFQKIFCSPLMRAKETCEIAQLFNQAEIDQDLVEWDYGNYEGKKTSDILMTNPNWNIFTSGAPGGESIDDVNRRASRVVSRIREIQGDIAIFSSGHFSRCLAAKWVGLPISAGNHLLLSTASCSILSYEQEHPVIMLWNEIPRPFSPNG